ncbi:MAG: isochorismatase family protein [Actinomycetota bacterium]
MIDYGRAVALVVVDVQNDFAQPDGRLAVRGGGDIVPFVNLEVERALAADATVAYTADWHPPSTPHFEKDGGIWPVHCVADTPGAAFHPDLRVEGPVILKGTEGEDGYSGFTARDPRTGETMPTGLGGLLRERGVTAIVVVGLATDYCVRGTALDGLAQGFDVTVLREGVRAVDRRPGDGDRALAEVRAAGGHVV